MAINRGALLLEASRSHFESDWSTEPEQSPEPDWSNDQSCSSQLKKIREFLVENREVDDLNFQESFWRIINRIQAALTFKAFGQAVEVKASQSTNEGLDFNSKLEFLESYLKKPLDHLQEYKFFLLVDKVDEIWDGSPSSNEMVIGLLMASKEINQMNSNVSCAVFLRTDIYEQLHFFDKDKLRGDEVPVLWNSTTLPEIILERARVSTKQEGMVAQDFWSQYFPSEVEGSKTSDFVVSHTLMRPRDVIQLCNLCADTARREGSDSVQEKHILQALDMYSSWKLNDLLGEYRVNYPFLNDLLIIFSNTSYVLPRVRLEEIYSRINLALEERYPTYRQLLSVDSCLNILYGIGFIGVERVGRVVFYYQDPRTVEDHDDVFIVHPAFRNALKCTSSIDIQPYSPVGGVSNSRRFTRRYLEQEFTRSRSPIRGSFESSVPSTSRFVRFLEQLDYFRRRVVREQQLPAEVVGEISRNLGLMINELTEAIEQDYDVIQLEMCRTNVLRYLEELREKLGNTGFLSGNSSINAELERLLSEKFSS